MKKKCRILLIGDTPTWIFASIIKFIINNLSDKFVFYYDYLIYNDYNILTDSRYEKLSFSLFLRKPRLFVKRVFSKISLIFNKNRKILYLRKYDIVFYLDYYFDVKGRFKFSKDTKIIKGIYTHAFPPGGMNYDKLNKIDLLSLNSNEFKFHYLNNISCLVVGSPTMVNFYKSFNNCVSFANICYDDNQFHPKYRIKKSDEFVIGWTGNPNSKTKGYFDYVLPIMDKLQKSDHKIKFKSRFSGPIEDLHLFYNDVDLIIVASIDDAGPSMFMEASLMGIPCVSTNVGFPAYVIRNGINGFIVDREIEQFIGRIMLLYEDKNLYNSFASRIREDFKSLLGKEIQVKNWFTLFDHVSSM